MIGFAVDGVVVAPPSCPNSLLPQHRSASSSSDDAHVKLAPGDHHVHVLSDRSDPHRPRVIVPRTDGDRSANLGALARWLSIAHNHGTGGPMNRLFGLCSVGAITATSLASALAACGGGAAGACKTYRCPGGRSTSICTKPVDCE